MSCDLTWLLLKPGMTITDRSHTNKPAEWVACPTHAVVVEHPEGRLLWDTSVGRDWETRWAPTGLQDFFPYDRVGEEMHFDSRLRQVGLCRGTSTSSSSAISTSTTPGTPRCSRSPAPG